MRFQAMIFALVCSFSMSSFAQESREGQEFPQLIPKGAFMRIDSVPVHIEDYDFLDPQNIVPDRPLELAVRYFATNKARITNRNFITVIDMSKKSSKKRMFVINMKTGEVKSYYTAHGKGSDSNNDGYATRFSNTEGSLATSVGFYLTGSQYNGKNGASMYLHGLEKTNSRAYERAIVMHGASYVQPGSVGRSWGCPAVEKKEIGTLIPQLQKGSLLYVHYNQ